MTQREQERCDAALSYVKDSKLDIPQVVTASSYFIAGAKWSDKNMLDKACKWLKEHYAPAGFVEGIFRKAMEE